MAEIYRRKVAALHEVLEDESVQNEAFELIRSLIEKVVVTPTDGGGPERPAGPVSGHPQPVPGGPGQRPAGRAAGIANRGGCGGRI